jgi:hypothetical protein
MGRYAETRKPIFRRAAALAAMSGLVLSYFVAIAPANAEITSPSPVDTSNAVRYNPDGSVIGDIVYRLVNTDDRSVTINAPFPINFFGTNYPSMCITTNGVIYPVASASVSCSAGRYDQGLEYLSLNNEVSAIAPLALDFRLQSANLRNPHRETTEELFFTSVSWVNGDSTSALTFTTSQPHGFRVGEFVKLNEEIGGTGVFEGRVTAVLSATTFTLLVGQKLNDDDGIFVPSLDSHPILYRGVIYQRLNRLELSGSTLTIRVDDDSSDFGVGGKLTLTGTGIPGLDNAKLSVLSRVDVQTFTVTVPASLVDLDPDNPGNQTIREFTDPSNRPWALERDEVGAINQIYFGTTTVNGKEAYALTWYRASNNDEYSRDPRTLSATIQLVIIKQSTGSNSEGWDFGFEYNIGHANDPSDGYRSDDPRNGCQPSNLSLCRWGMGTAGYFPGSQISFYSVPDASKLDELVVETSTPHGLTSGQSVRVGDGLRNLYSSQLANFRPVSQILGTNTFILKTPPGSPFSTVIARTAGPSDTRIGYSKSYELFANSPTPELIDSAGATSLVRNSLNSTVLGRYTFGMSGGNVTGFLTPTMGNGISGTVPGTTAPSVMSVINVNPTNITVENEIITIMGANLNTVTDVYIGGIKVKIFSQSGNRLQIRAPKGLSGLVDLELKSSLNDVLMTKKLNFGGTAAAGSKKATLVVGGFDHNSRKLTARMKARIDRWLTRNSDLGTLTCTGFTSLPRRTTDVTLSTKRGLTACNYSKRQRSDLETSVSQGIEDPRPGSNVRRVRLVLTP